ESQRRSRVLLPIVAAGGNTRGGRAAGPHRTFADREGRSEAEEGKSQRGAKGAGTRTAADTGSRRNFRKRGPRVCADKFSRGAGRTSSTQNRNGDCAFASHSGGADGAGIATAAGPVCRDSVGGGRLAWRVVLSRSRRSGTIHGGTRGVPALRHAGRVALLP